MSPDEAHLSTGRALGWTTILVAAACFWGFFAARLAAAEEGHSDGLAAARHALHHHAGGQKFGMLLVDRFELQDQDEGDVGVLDAYGWYGGDLNRLAVEVEAEYLFDREQPLGALEHGGDADWEELEVSLFWTRAVARYFDFKVGARYDVEPESEAYAVIGLQGLAPYWFEIDAELFLNEEGVLSASFEAEYEVLFTQRLIGQFRFEFEANGETEVATAEGSGLSHGEAGFRLRYEIRREFAPYLGVDWQQAFGRTKDLLAAAGEEAEGSAAVAGIRFWF